MEEEIDDDEKMDSPLGKSDNDGDVWTTMMVRPRMVKRRGWLSADCKSDDNPSSPPTTQPYDGLARASSGDRSPPIWGLIGVPT